jgi:phospholipase C
VLAAAAALMHLVLLLAPQPAGAAASASAPRQQQKVEHAVFLLMENRPFDQIFGCMAGEGELAAGADGIHGSRPLPRDPRNTSSADNTSTVSCGTGDYVCEGGWGYAPWAPKFGNSSQAHEYPYGGAGAQGDEYSYKNGAKAEGIKMFSGAQLPIKREIAREFGVFNKYYASVPSYSAPNHLFAQSATSCGISSNGGFPWSTCGGGNGTLYPQPTIFDSMAKTHGDTSFKFYINDTDPTGSDTKNDTLAVFSPDTMMAGLDEGLPSFSLPHILVHIENLYLGITHGSDE